MDGSVAREGNPQDSFSRALAWKRAKAGIALLLPATSPLLHRLPFLPLKAVSLYCNSSEYFDEIKLAWLFLPSPARESSVLPLRILLLLLLLFLFSQETLFSSPPPSLRCVLGP